MKTRRDGEATRESILVAACRVFGDKGFHKATHAEISADAGVNSALISFHFGSKGELYRAAWKYTAEYVESLYPMSGGIPTDVPAAERLRGHIRTLLNIALDPRLEGFHRILWMEVIYPTGLLDDELSKHRRKHRSFVMKLIRNLVGPDASDETVRLCEMSVISQCHILLPKPPIHKNKKFHRFEHADVESLVEHIVRFSLAGIDAIRNENSIDNNTSEDTQS